MASPIDFPSSFIAEDRGYVIINMTIAVAIIVTVAVALRFVARGRSKAPFGFDDYHVLINLVPLYAMLACGCLRRYLSTCNLEVLF